MNPLSEAMSEAIEVLITETKARLDQLEKTREGLQQRIELETHHLKLLKEKRNQIAHRNPDNALIEASIPDYIAKLLFEKGEPMRAIEIANALTECGIKTNAENGHISAVLSALSRRTDLFQRIERGLYTLKCEQKKTKRSNEKWRMIKIN